MKIPGFTAEASIYKTSECYQAAGHSASLAGGGGILPQRRATCRGKCLTWWIRWYFEAMCDAVGGGLSTNPDGSISCDFEDKKTNSKAKD